MKARKSLQSMAAILALLLVAVGSKAQYNPYQGSLSNQQMVFMGYGAPPVMVTGNGQIQPYLNTYGAPFDPYFGNPYYGFIPENPYQDISLGENPYSGYPYSGYPQNGLYQGADMGRSANGWPQQSGRVHRNGQVVEQRDQAGQIMLGWMGNPRNVASITFALLNAKRQPIDMRSITSEPAQILFTDTSHTAYYKVVVQYLNGSTRTVTKPIR